MATFRELCGDHYTAVVAYEPYMSSQAKGFVNHVAREPDRDLSASQADWAVEIRNRAIVQQRISQGLCALPRTLDDDDDDSFEEFLNS